MKKQIKYISAGMLAGMLLCGGELQASNRMTEMHVCLADAIQKDNRPEISNRLFRSNAVEKEILRVQKLLKNAKLAWMFTNCFPNTLDTTVHFRKGSDGKPDTFVYTGDIHAMWLRDLCPSLPMARLSWSSGTMTRHSLPSSDRRTSTTSAGARATFNLALLCLYRLFLRL